LCFRRLTFGAQILRGTSGTADGETVKSSARPSSIQTSSGAGPQQPPYCACDFSALPGGQLRAQERVLGPKIRDLVPCPHGTIAIAIFLDCASRHFDFLLGGHSSNNSASRGGFFRDRTGLNQWVSRVSRRVTFCASSLLLMFSLPLARERTLPCAFSRCRSHGPFRSLMYVCVCGVYSFGYS